MATLTNQRQEAGGRGKAFSCMIFKFQFLSHSTGYRYIVNIVKEKILFVTNYEYFDIF
jgi:hypothetical protein